jgi:hypothetical protein
MSVDRFFETEILSGHIATNEFGLEAGRFNASQLSTRTNFIKIPSLAERAKHSFTPLKVRRVNFLRPALL